MFLFEGVAIAYFTALACAAPFLRPRSLNIWRAALSAAAVGAVILALAYVAPTGARAWLAHAYLVAGYWIPALLVTGIEPGAFEAWLVRSDAWWRRWRVPLPRAAAVAFELSYLLCYALVPAAFAVVFVSGTRVDVDRFWTAVLVSGFACYGTLPWLIARPPRLGSDPGDDPTQGVDTTHHRGLTPVTRRLNVFVLTRGSHGHNTFPSGHVAVSIAAALVVFGVSPAAGAVMLLIAAGIAAGATAGRYHYTIDVVLGALIGIAAAVIF